MEGQQISVRTICQNDKCQKPLNFRHTSYGKVQLRCPKCLIKQVFVIEPGANPGEGIAVPNGIVRVAPTRQPIDQFVAPNQHLHQQAMPAEKTQICLREAIIVGKLTMIFCPHCGYQASVTIKQEGKGKLKCKNCGGVFGFVAKSIPTPNPQPKPFLWMISHIAGRLVGIKKGLLRRNVTFNLTVGENIVGRRDNVWPSTIQINDKYMNRKSVCIEVKDNPNGYIFTFTLLNSLNPAYFNGQRIMEGYSCPIVFGDKFRIGATDFIFEGVDGSRKPILLQTK